MRSDFKIVIVCLMKSWVRFLFCLAEDGIRRCLLSRGLEDEYNRQRQRLPVARIYYLAGDLSPQSIRRIGLTGIDYAAEVLHQHPEWVAQAHDLGLEVNVWTVDSEEEMRHFIDLGVDYITTDYPERLQALLAE